MAFKMKGPSMHKGTSSYKMAHKESAAKKAAYKKHSALKSNHDSMTNERWSDCFRLYRSRFLQANAQFAEFFKIFRTFAPLHAQNVWKIRQPFRDGIMLTNICKFCEFQL